MSASRNERLPRNARRSERRAALLDAAIEAVRAEGPGVTMERLAAAGGVTKPILYRHFGDRDGLISAIADRFAGELLAEVRAPLAAAELGARALLEGTIDAYVGFVEREPGLYRFLVQQASGGPGGATRVSHLIDTTATQVAVVIVDRLRSAGLDTGPALAWAHGIIGLVHQAADWWVRDRTISREALVGHLAALLWDGLGGAATPDRGRAASATGAAGCS